MESLTERMFQVTLRGRPLKFSCGTDILAGGAQYSYSNLELHAKYWRGAQYSYGNLELHDNGMRYLTRHQGKYDILYDDITGIYMFDYGFTILLKNGKTKHSEVTFNHSSSQWGRKPEPINAVAVVDYHKDIVNFVNEITKRVNVTVVTPDDME